MTRRAFTLVEMVIALGLLVGVAVAAQAVLKVCIKATTTNDAARKNRNIEMGLDQLREELAEATAITVLGAHAISFSVPDRDSDNIPETIRIGWANAKQAPLTRQVNTNPETNLIDHLDSFTLEWALGMRTDSPLLTTDPEIVIAGSTSLPNNTGDMLVSSLTWAAFVVNPALPETTSSWTVTHVRVRAVRTGFGFNPINVELHAASGMAPQGPALAQTAVPLASFPWAYAWVDILLPPVALPATTTSIAFVFKGNDAFAPITLRYGEAQQDAPYDLAMWGLGPWVSIAARDLRYEVYGTITTPSVGNTAYSVDSVLITAGLDDAAPPQTSILVPLINRPLKP